MSANELYKKFEYRGYDFMIKAHLNHSAERHPGGKNLHRFTISSMGSANWSTFEDVAITASVHAIANAVMRLESAAREHIDKLFGEDITMQLLHDLGFTANL